MKTLIVLILLGAGGYWLYTESIGFDDAEIARVQTSISDEYKKRGNSTVEEVKMLKKSARELTGFVRLRRTGSADDYTVSCTATMADGGKNYIWSCGR